MTCHKRIFVAQQTHLLIYLLVNVLNVLLVFNFHILFYAVFPV